MEYCGKKLVKLIEIIEYVFVVTESFRVSGIILFKDIMKYYVDKSKQVKWTYKTCKLGSLPNGENTQKLNDVSPVLNIQSNLGFLGC